MVRTQAGKHRQRTVRAAYGARGEGRLEQMLLGLGCAVAAGLQRQQPRHDARLASSAYVPAGAAVDTPVGVLALKAAGVGGWRVRARGASAAKRTGHQLAVGACSSSLPAGRLPNEELALT